MGIFSAAANFDLYRKVPRDLSEGTIPGGVISICSIIVMAILFISELIRLMDVDVISQMTLVPPGPPGDLMDINIDLSIKQLPCEFITVNSQDVLGNREINLNTFFKKTRLSLSGEELPPVHFTPTETEHPQNIFNSMFGMVQGDLNSYPENEKQQLRLQYSDKEGCRLQGTINVNKVPGAIFISIKRHFNMLSEFAHGLQNVDLKHTVNHLSFGDHEELKLALQSFPTLRSGTELTPMDGKVLAFDESNTKTGNKIFEIYAKVVTTTFEDVAGAMKMKQTKERINQQKRHDDPNFNDHKLIDATEVVSSDNHIQAYQFTGSYNILIHHTIPAIYIRYDVSPVMVTYKREKETLWRFIVHVCAILGGVFSLAGIVDSLVHGGQHIILKHRANKMG